MSGNTKVLSRIGPWGRTVIAEVVGNETIMCGNCRSLWLPVLEVHPSSVNKDNWCACPLFNVKEINTIHANLMHHCFPSTGSPGLSGGMRQPHTYVFAFFS